MPKGVRLPVSGQMLETVRACCRRGLKATAIANLQMDIFQGFNVKAIQRIISRMGLADPRLGKAVSRAQRLSPTRKQRLLDFLQQEGRDMPDSQVARKMGVSKHSAIRLRLLTVGKRTGRRRYCAATKAMRREKVSRRFACRREEQCDLLCALQTRLERESCSAPVQECETCGDRRFALRDFFYRDSRKKAGGFFRSCRTCMAEMRFLGRGGKKHDEILRVMATLYQLPAKTEIGELIGRMCDDTHRRCADPLVRCRRCRSQWYFNNRYFHEIAVGGKVGLLDSCLACPAARRFFCT